MVERAADYISSCDVRELSRVHPTVCTKGVVKAVGGRSQESVFEQHADRHLQSAREDFYRVERRVRLAAFYPAHVGPGQSTAVSECFLRHACCSPKGSNTFTKFLSERGSHAHESGSAYTIAPRTNRDSPMSDRTETKKISLDIEDHPYAGVIRWENLSNGDEHTLALERPNENIVSIVTELLKRYPRITWRITTDGKDTYDSSLNTWRGQTWRVICVPEDEWSTAEGMLDGWLGPESACQRRFPNSK